MTARSPRTSTACRTAYACQVALAAWAVFVGSNCATAMAQTPYRNSFEGPDPAWRDLGGDCRYQLEIRRRQTGARSGDGVEYVRSAAANGSFVHIGLDVGPVALIEEFRPSLWLRSDRPNLQLSAHVVLPRTIDPSTGKPLEALLRGTQYLKIGQWEQLRLDHATRQLERLVPILQAQIGSKVVVDSREAYVDRMVLNVYGGQGGTEVWIDDLELPGYVKHAVEGARVDAASTDGMGDYSYKPRPEVRLSESTAMVDGKPFFLKAVRHQGESLSVLRDLGFNGVWLDRPPNESLFREADEFEMWLVCPPPADAGIGPRHRRVLAWNAGWNLPSDALQHTVRMMDEIRRADREAARPFVCVPANDLEAYSRHVEILAAHRAPIATTFELADYSDWLRGRFQAARPGAPWWAFVQTETPAELTTALANRRRPTQEDEAADPRAAPSFSEPVAYDQLRLATLTAAAAGVRGVVFDSRSRLDVPDPDVLARARSLERINLELDLIAPFSASGGVGAALSSSEPHVVAPMLVSGASRMLLPMWLGPHAQFAPGQAAPEFTLVAPGVPEASDVFEVGPGGFRPLRHHRVAGGERIYVREFGLASLILITKDPGMIARCRRRTAEVQVRSAQLARALSHRRLLEADAAARRLTADHSAVFIGQQLAAAHANLELADRSLSMNDGATAYRALEGVDRSLRGLTRRLWVDSMEQFGDPLSSPFTATLKGLPEQQLFLTQLRHSHFGENRIVGGDFESLEQLMQSGWRNQQYPTLGVEQSANLSDRSVFAGRYCLMLQARPTQPLVGDKNDRRFAAFQTSKAILETPPVWITTPAVNVSAGQWVRIHGRVMVPKLVEGGADGLLITDSFGGFPLSLRFRKTEGWREFNLFRQSPGNAPLTVSFALTGLGEAYLDEVSIRVVEPGAAAADGR